MADLLSSLLEILAPSAAAAQPPGGPPVPEVDPSEGPAVAPSPQRFGFGGGMRQAPMPVSAPQPAPQPPMATPGGHGMPVADDMRRLFMPAAAPQQVVRRAAPPQADPGTVTGADVQRFIRSVATGAGRADPRAPGVSAFAQGAMGATQNSYGEMEREKAQALAERRADTQDRRADNALAMQGARDQRAEDEYRRKVTRDEKVDAERQVRTRERLARIAKIEDQRLDSKDIGRIGDQVNRHARYLQVEVNNARMTPEQAEQSLEQYKRDTIEKFVKRDPGAKAGPAMSAPAPGAMIKHGDKTYRFKGGDPADQNNYEKVN